MRFKLGLILCLFPVLVFSQIKIENKTSITFFKFYNESTHIPCNPFISKTNEYVSLISKKVVDCDSLVLNFLKLKEKLKDRKHQELDCQKDCRGCPTIENMLVLEFNKLVDTLYFNEKRIIDYNNHKEYFGENNDIIQLLFKNQDLKDFFEIDFEKISQNLYFEKRDSIPIKNFKINNKSIYGKSRKEINDLIKGFDNIRMDSYQTNDGVTESWNIEYKCWKNDCEFYFDNTDKLSKIIIHYSKDKDLKPTEILGFKVNDIENSLMKEFPNSYKVLSVEKKYFREKDNTYSLSLSSIEKNGWINFILNEEKIVRIEINFRNTN